MSKLSREHQIMDLENVGLNPALIPIEYTFHRVLLLMI